MRRVDTCTIELTNAELTANVNFESFLDQGMEVPNAGLTALRRAKVEHGMFATQEFVNWMSEGTVLVWGDDFRICTAGI